MKKISIGILAHVDAGKTTLTESMLYLTGAIRNQGRVDNGDAFLDTESLEKKRGVTIHSKQAVISLSKEHELNAADDDVRITIIDTPGHTDFVGETERAIRVLDLAVLLISAPDGVTDSGRKLVSMLNEYKVPYVVFVNKMDMSQRGRDEIIEELKNEFGSGLITEDNTEDIASLTEQTIEKYLDTGTLSGEDIISLIYSGVFHPVLFGAALKNEGTDELIRFLTSHIPDFGYRDTFSARVFKVTYEEGHKISFMKVTGGNVSVRDILPDERLSGQKITQIRLYNGGRYETLDHAEPGDVVAVAGCEDTFAGMGIGEEIDETGMISRPVLRYRVILPDDVPARLFVPKLKELADEDPLLELETGDGASADDGLTGVPKAKTDGAITISVMGEFQLEILASTIEERFGVKVKFDSGRIIYKETIASPVIGYGHFEPLRHYAEVQLLMEPLPNGSGIEVASDVSVSDLGINWQKTILNTLITDLPAGVLTGSALTDIRFTLIDGKSHVKHTQSTDFREAARRGVRQGLMKADTVLLEPFYEYRMSIPTDFLGRAMNDMNMAGGTCNITDQDSDRSVLKGEAPARALMNYQSALTGYTSGQGYIEIGFAGYRPCDETQTMQATEEIAYDPEKDTGNLSGSVFCSHGAGVYIPWYECEKNMHLESRENEYLYGVTETEEEKLEHEAEIVRRIRNSEESEGGRTNLYKRLDAIGTDEIDSILRSTTHANASTRKGTTKRVYHSKRVISADTGASASKRNAKPVKARPKYLLVDGYNIIHAWDELKKLLGDDPYSMDGAKYRLLDMLSEYRVVRDTEVIAVFDAYKVKGHFTEKIDYMGVHVVYTKEAETADQYIARFTVINSKDLDISVATSDGLVQLIIRGENCRALSAGDLLEDVKRAHRGE